MWRVIPVYTTDTVPIDGSPPVTHAWPVWTVAADVGQGLETLAVAAGTRGAHAIIGVHVTTFSSTPLLERCVLMGTAVVLGHDPGPTPAQ
jgi:hypothetical protein